MGRAEYKLAEALIQPSNESIEDVFYFTAFATWMNDKCQRHKNYVTALKATGVTPIIGHFKSKNRRCHTCKAKWVAHEEKQSDVNLAVHLLHNAHLNNFDKALIITSDSDLCPVIDLIINTYPDKEIEILTPPNRYKISREIRNHVVTRKIKNKQLCNSLLPKYIYKKSTGRKLIKRPVNYKPIMAMNNSLA